MLDKLGVQFDTGIILQQSEDFAPSLFKAPLTAAGMKLLDTRPSPRLMSGMVFPGATTISWNHTDASHTFNIVPFIVTDTISNILRKAPVNDSLRVVKFDSSIKDEKGSFPVVVALTRKINNREQRILVSRDADFMSNTELLRSNIQTGNFIFLMELFRWFSYDNFPVDVYKEPSVDNGILTDASGVSSMTWLLSVILPAAIVIAVAIILIRR